MRAHYLNRRTFGRLFSTLVVVCLLSLSVSAYTLIMRSGRRVEIPAQFWVTDKTLTYEVSPSLEVTVQLDAIDIAATEKANNEQPGSFRTRLREVPGLIAAPGLNSKGTATKTITNRDLESAMRRRKESEAAYDRRRKELGLPSLEESRRKEAAESEQIAAELAESRAAQQESESYWRARASALRTEIASVDAQLAYVRQRLGEPDVLTSNGSLGFFASFATFGNFGRHGGFSRPGGRPGVFVAPRGGTQVNGGIRFGGGATRGRVLINPMATSRSFGTNFGWRYRSSNTLLAPVGQDYLVLDERNRLITQFNQLSAASAGLKARWRELEDEARRAGAPPGWLRP